MIQRVVFGKAGWSIDLAGCEEIAAQLPNVFVGWDISVGTLAEFKHYRPRAKVTRQKDGWHWREIGAPKPRHWDRIAPKSAMRVMTDIHDVAIYWYLDENPHLLCLHGGAVKIGEGLICFPARGFSGKSTLIANLASLGHKVFADDVLALKPKGNPGMSLGFLPRLRTPLPPNMAPSVARYIESHLGPNSHGWLYLKPDPAKIARLAQTAKITAIINLDRAEEGGPVLEEVNTAAILKNLIAENIIRKIPMPEIFDRLHGLASGCQRYRLRYSDALEAAQFLSKRFS
jgi:hypothetical protein